MPHPRKLLALALVANLLFAGFVGTVHVHEHGEDCGSCRSAKIETTPLCACGHHHGPAPTEGSPYDAPVPADHDDCPVCQLIATAWLSPAVTTIVDLPTVVSPVRVETTTDPVVAPTTLVRLRGPPTVG